jgi:hypothetical protein
MAFIKVKRVRDYEYVILAESYRDQGRVKQRELFNFGKVGTTDVLELIPALSSHIRDIEEAQAELKEDIQEELRKFRKPLDKQQQDEVLKTVCDKLGIDKQSACFAHKERSIIEDELYPGRDPSIDEVLCRECRTGSSLARAQDRIYDAIQLLARADQRLIQAKHAYEVLLKQAEGNEGATNVDVVHNDCHYTTARGMEYESSIHLKRVPRFRHAERPSGNDIFAGISRLRRCRPDLHQEYPFTN